MKHKIYLDNCCYNRPFDDQSQLRIELETMAKLYIQQLVIEEKIELVWSYVLEYENDNNRILAKRNEISKWKDKASKNIQKCLKIESIANKITDTGVKTLDALHVACAIYAKCDYIISTDDRILKYTDKRIKLVNPFEFVRLYGGEKNEK